MSERQDGQVTVVPRVAGYPSGHDEPGPTGRQAGAPLELTRQQRPKELLLPHAEFVWLKDYQHRAPSPRLDLRYYAEGAIVLLGSTTGLRQQWLQLSRQALLEHLQRHTQASDESGLGTVGPSGSGEGAQARTQGQARSHDRFEQACKALHVGEGTFVALKSLQEATRDPRVGMRYLLEGAVRVLQQRVDLHTDWVSHARRALQLHLAQLQQQVNQSL